MMSLLVRGVVVFPLLLVMLVLNCEGAPTSSPCITLAQGTVCGKHDAGYNQDLFLGVPFAQPPIGQLRFAKPQLIANASSTTKVIATSFGPSCPQIDSNDSSNTTSEDCLSLNVYRPAGVSNSSTKVPVMHYFYGGSFLQGSSARYNASVLVEQSAKANAPIIVVTSNYRLGPLGFLASSEVLEGQRNGSAVLNAALHDQRLALHWVQKNIGAFGGDSSKVTMFGQSAGAVSVALQLLYKGGKTDGLYRAAIMESGSASIQPVLNATSPFIESRYSAFAKLAGCGNNSESTLSCLRTVSVDQIINASTTLGEQYGMLPTAGLFVFPPTLDPDFTPISPAELVQQGGLADVPIISGDVNDEGTEFTPQTFVNQSIFAGFLQVLSGDTTNNTSVIDEILQQYPDIPAIGSPYTNLATKGSQGTLNATTRFYPPLTTNQFKRAASLVGDLFFQAQRRLLLSNAIHTSRKNSNKVYSYIFRQNDINSSVIDQGATGGLTNPAAEGVGHASDLVYVFGNTMQRNSTGLIQALSNKMQRAWISFAVHLDPTKIDTDLPWSPYIQDKKIIQWKSYNVTSIHDTYREQQMDFLMSNETLTYFKF